MLPSSVKTLLQEGWFPGLLKMLSVGRALTETEKVWPPKLAIDRWHADHSTTEPTHVYRGISALVTRWMGFGCSWSNERPSRAASTTNKPSALGIDALGLLEAMAPSCEPSDLGADAVGSLAGRVSTKRLKLGRGHGAPIADETRRLKLGADRVDGAGCVDVVGRAPTSKRLELVGGGAWGHC
jgi:hypothetical protein